MWSPQQDAALLAVSNWYQNRTSPVFRLFGYAGTGKTTLARHIAEGIDGQVLFGAYTGKAAHVLSQKGCPNAQTIHSMIYKPSMKSESRYKALEQELSDLLRRIAAEPSNLKLKDDEGKLREALRLENLELKKPSFNMGEGSIIQDAKLLIIDECSMVDSQMGSDLESFGIPILVLGDPAQLPPVKGGGYFTNYQPDVMLTEIHRQARDNPIIRMATDVRLGKELQPGKYGDSEVTSGRLPPEFALSVDQILVGLNRTRKGANARVRSLKGYVDPYPKKDEKLVCLHNNHDLGILNGAMFYANDNAVVDDADDVLLHLRPEDDENKSLVVSAHKAIFEGREDDLSYWEMRSAEQFYYGYAITVHKSQGSQWNNVMLVDEWNNQSRKEWLYTGITRAAEKITIVRN